jgi:predicted HTH transcriptional regulator
MELQELITRGRLLFGGAEKRLQVFNLINGKRTGKEIAKQTGRSQSSVLQDLQRMRDMGLVRPVLDGTGVAVKKDGAGVFEKVPELRHIRPKYFDDPVAANRKLGRPKLNAGRTPNAKRHGQIRVPNQNEILDICRTGEDHFHEFKAAGTDSRKITKELAAFAHTRDGDILFYGIDDDGTVSGSDKRRQELDQSVQNSVRNTIKPALHVEVRQASVLAQVVLLVIVPPWNGKDVYFYEDRVYIRKGTNAFVATPDECKKLHRGEYIC